MVAACKNAYLSLGSKERILSKEEEAQALEMRRSAVALHDLNQGKIIRSSDIEFKRPGTGIAPDKFQNFLGKKLNTSVKKGELIHEINFQQN
jgi:N-acetylneuraminate synthase